MGFSSRENYATENSNFVYFIVKSVLIVGITVSFIVLAERYANACGPNTFGNGAGQCVPATIACEKGVEFHEDADTKVRTCRSYAQTCPDNYELKSERY